MNKLLIIFFVIINSNIALAKNTEMEQDLFCAGALMKLSELINNNINRFDDENKKSLPGLSKHIDANGKSLFLKYVKPDGKIPNQDKVKMLFDKGTNYASNEIGNNIEVGLNEGQPQYSVIRNCLLRVK